MRLSWNSLGWVIKTGCLSLLLAAILWVLSFTWPENDVLLLALLIAWLGAASAGCFGAGSALLYFGGVLKITCPLCGAVSRLVPVGANTYLRCPSCGNVHAQGWFVGRYGIEVSEPQDASVHESRLAV